jgi:hypothetical protein
MDGRSHSSLKARLEQALGLSLAEADRLQTERERLSEENVRLAREIARLTQENEALRESAEIWIRMYENQLERANDAVRRLAACADAHAASAPDASAPGASGAPLQTTEL